MKCPKCGNEINDNALACPHCKKVFQLQCPICGALNKTNICADCGYVILSKCHKCGRINHTIEGKCKRCGFDTNVSAIIQSANISEFATLSIDFPNLKELVKTFESDKLFQKFNARLNKLIYDMTKSKKIRRQIIGTTYVIRFNKDYTYTSSVKNALQFAIELLNFVEKINYKLKQKGDITLQCSMAILKRTAYAKNDDYRSGVNIQVMYQNLTAESLKKNLQLIVDTTVYDAANRDYKFNSIGMCILKGQSVFLYELDLENYVKYEPEEKTESQVVDISDAIGVTINSDEDEKLEEETSIYDIEGIEFEEIKCEFTKASAQGLATNISDLFSQQNKRIVVLKGRKKYQPRTKEITTKIKQKNIFTNIVNICCYREMKYKPYAFFAELISEIRGYSNVSNNNNDFSIFKSIDNKEYIKSIINCQIKNDDSDETSSEVEQIFNTIFSGMQNTLIVIEDANNIDEMSFQILVRILSRFEELNISYIFIANKDFRLHGTAHFLLGMNKYTEIFLQPTPINVLIQSNAELCKNIIDTFYMQKIKQYTKGSQIYFMMSLLHLLEMGVLKITDGSFELNNEATVMLPATLDELLQKKLFYMKKISADLFKFIVDLIILGPVISLETLKFLNTENTEEYLQILSDKDFIEINDKYILIQNYNSMFENLPKVLSDEELENHVTTIIKTCFKENEPSPCLERLYSLIGEAEKDFEQLNAIAKVSKSIGDFNTYLNCCIKAIDIISINAIDNEENNDLTEYKKELYTNISNMLSSYTNEKISRVAPIVIDALKNYYSGNESVILYNKILKSCISSGNFSQALAASQCVLSNIDRKGINPQEADYNPIAFYANLNRIEILFNTGHWDETITLGKRIFNIVQQCGIDKFITNKINISQVKKILTDTAEYILFAMELQMETDIEEFSNQITNLLGSFQNSYNYFKHIIPLLQNNKISLDSNYSKTNKFSGFLYNIMDAFTSFTDEKNLAEKFYQAKLEARKHKLYQMELFSDLMIGRVYFKLQNYKKSSVIFNSVLDMSINSGFTNLVFLAWYSIAEQSLIEENIQNASSLVKNALVQLESNNYSNMYILMLFKLLQSKILKLQNETKEADFCYNQYIKIANKYNIKTKK